MIMYTCLLVVGTSGMYFCLKSIMDMGKVAEYLRGKILMIIIIIIMKNNVMIIMLYLSYIHMYI